MLDYDSVAKGGNIRASAQARRRVLKACYAGSGRTPTFQDDITVGSDRKTEAPTTPMSPIVPPVLIASPRVITACDPTGCWDNLGMRYNGVGAALIGPTGKLCLRIGDQIDCR